ncbi:hypothetical protein [Parendozoicomonas sp. Alg238-R29]|uniref:hypothetical protein n=1 Tax=Parendozoicomonas sp. Alg238-R29 TaxID=2993446 RepID=UPI00248DCEDF|nr:hypothetical protein [Parendozoicomonas sp. Alg238-R29]
MATGSTDGARPSLGREHLRHSVSHPDRRAKLDTSSLSGRMARSDIKPHTPERHLSTSSTSSTGSSDSNQSSLSIGDRSVSSADPDLAARIPTSLSADIPSRGKIDTGDGGEIIFERVNDGDLPTVKDKLRDQFHQLEKSGKIDGAKKSKMEKFLSGASTALDFLMHNKKFQTGIGLVGIGACIIGGAFCPVLLIGVGPFILIFANGFIDNPMLTGPESQPPQPTPDNSNKTPDGNDPSGTKSKPTDGDDPNNPKPKSPDGADAAAKDADKKRREAEDERKADELRRKAAQKLKAAGYPGHTLKVKGTADGPELKEALELMQKSPLKETPERHTYQTFDASGYINSQQFTGGTYNFSHASANDLANLREAIASQANRVSLQYQPVEVREEVGRLGPDANDLKAIKNALTKEVINQLFEHVRNHGSIPASSGDKSRHGLNTQQLVEEAARRIGLPVEPDLPADIANCSLVQRIMGGDPHDYKQALDEWCKSIKILLPQRN